jgi:MFS family permease
LSGGSWVLAALADNIWALYFTYGVLGGIGTGIVYVGIIGLMVRWFPDRRGLATPALPPRAMGLAPSSRAFRSTA